MKHELSSVVCDAGHKLYAAGGWTLLFAIWGIVFGMFLAIVCVFLSPEQ